MKRAARKLQRSLDGQHRFLRFPMLRLDRLILNNWL